MDNRANVVRPCLAWVEVQGLAPMVKDEGSWLWRLTSWKGYAGGVGGEIIIVLCVGTLENGLWVVT